MKHWLPISFLLSFVISGGYAQIGGLRSFEFVNIPGDSRTAALGGTNVSLSDKDVNAFNLNPALLDSSMVNYASASYLNYLGGINFSNINYALNHRKIGLLGVNLKYINYGNIDRFDASGQEQGAFSANEFVVGLSHARNSGLFQLGTTLKFAYSGLAGYNAASLLLDVGGSFKHPEKDLQVGLTVKNVGLILTDYTEISDTDLPFDVQAGVSFKPEHMPIRFSATVYNLYKADITYFDPNFEGNAFDEEKPGTIDNLFRHMLFAAEFMPGNNFHIRVGYNHLMRRELRLEELSGGAGFSFGLMFRVKAFQFAYSKALYHVAGSTNQITISSDLKQIKKRSIKLEN